MGAAACNPFGAVAMKFPKDPPIIRHACSWPPIWVRRGTGRKIGPKTIKGEIGTLKEVRYYSERCGRIYLTIEHDGAIYVGCVFIEKDAICRQVLEHLRHCLRMSISAIGDSELR